VLAGFVVGLGVTGLEDRELARYGVEDIACPRMTTQCWLGSICLLEEYLVLELDVLAGHKYFDGDSVVSQASVALETGV
jgi:hypothetical protein